MFSPSSNPLALQRFELFYDKFAPVIYGIAKRSRGENRDIENLLCCVFKTVWLQMQSSNYGDEEILRLAIAHCRSRAAAIYLAGDKMQLAIETPGKK